MNKIKKGLNYLIHPGLIIKRQKNISLNKNSKNYSDEDYIKKCFKLSFDYDLDLSNPKTFNEKLQWLKLNYRLPLFNKMVDKYEVKDIVTKKIGNVYIAKTYGIYDSFDDIDFSKLPNKFVIKTTHDCGGVIICKDKKNFDKEKAKDKINKHLKVNYYWHCREWPYKDVKPRILVEEYLESKNNVLPVYKIFCFAGKPYLIQAIQNDKTDKESIDYFDLNWNKLNLKQNFPNSKILPLKPKNLDKMVQIASLLADSFLPFIRVDLYNIDGNIYFSEYTFYSDAGFAKFFPSEWDKKLGDMIDLNLCKK